MSPQTATRQNARELKPELLRNEIVQDTDQMGRIQVDAASNLASALNTFPLINVDDPEAGWYTISKTKGPMSPVGLGAEAPLGTLTLPDKDNIETEVYKKKYQPDKGAETAAQGTPWSLYEQAGDDLRIEIFLTREQFTWRGDDSIDGLIGQYGTSEHPDIPTANVEDVATSWDADTATPYDDITSLGQNIVNNGRMFDGQAMPTLFAPPSAVIDAKRSEEMRDLVASTQTKALSQSDVADLIEDEIAAINRVMVYVPRTNANGEFLDDAGVVVDTAEEAAHDNILEPYDPDSGTQVRNVVIGRPGPSSAYIPWFGEALGEYAANVPPSGRTAVDNQNGFMSHVWTGNDPIVTSFKAMQEVGFEVYGQNWGVLRGI